MSKKKTPVVVDVNAANVSELTAIPHMNAALAQHIAEDQPYTRFEDLLRVKGMGPRLLERLRPYIKLSPLDVNKAQIEDLAALPRLPRAVAEKIIAGRPYTKLEDLRAIKGMGARSLEQLEPYLVIDEIVEGKEEKSTIEESSVQPLIAVGSTTGTQAVLLPSEELKEEEAQIPEKQSFPPEAPVLESQSAQASPPHEKKPWTTRAIQIIAPETTLPPRHGETPSFLTRGDGIAWAFGIGVLAVILSVIVSLSILAIANGGLRFGSVQQVSALQGDLQALQAQATVLVQDVDGLRNRLDGLETLSGQINTLENQVDTLDLNVQDLNGQIDGFQTQLDSINSEISLIQQGYQKFEQFLNGLNELMGNLFNGTP
jgi:DNA uptake protein ComE-like DNA-binding protein/prefoldin subunit 5